MELNPNCSESVFRFYTLDPEEMQQILQYLADEISADTSFERHKGQRIPLLPRAEDYGTMHNPPTKEDWREYEKGMDHIRSEYARDETRRRTELGKLWHQFNKKQYPNGSLLYCCAGLGDNETVIAIEKEKDAFRLNIGNNDIQQNTTGWVEKIKAMGIKVEEAETAPELKKYARDCTCGIVYGFHEQSL